MDLDERLRPLYEEIRECWGQDTAYRGKWSPENPALNQCLPTALLVQDFWGGDILRCRVRDGDGRAVSHYFNCLEDDTICDLTAEQFAQPRYLYPVEVCDRRQLLDSGDVGERYRRLKERFLHNRFGEKGYREFAPSEGGGR